MIRASSESAKNHYRKKNRYKISEEILYRKALDLVEQTLSYCTPRPELLVGKLFC